MMQKKKKNSNGAAEYFLLLVLGPGSVFCCCCSCVTAWLHPVKVLAGWDKDQGSRHTRGFGGGVKGREAGRCHACSQGKRERVAGKKNLILIILQSPPLKIHFDLLKTKPQRKKKKAQDVKYTYICH